MTFSNSYSVPFNDVTGPVLGRVCRWGCSCNAPPLDVKLTPRCPPPCPPQNKEFVCRGHDYERLEAFQQRMLNEFPHAIAMQHVNQPDQTIYQADAQCILGCRKTHIQNTFLQASSHEICAKQKQPNVWKCIQTDNSTDTRTHLPVTMDIWSHCTQYDAWPYVLKHKPKSPMLTFFNGFTH